MSFCSYSSQLIVENKTQVENMFITSYMPYANGDYVKVYLYGLLCCNDSNQTHNNLEQFSKALNMTFEQIEEAYLYWQDQGIVQILDTMPKEVRYLPLSTANVKHQKIKNEKYTSFNLQAQEIIADRMIMPNEYYEYYITMESLHIDQDAFIMIMKYCTNLKGTNVNYPYILTVAKNWASEGCTTAEAVNQKLLGYEQQNENMALLLKTMKVKRAADSYERDLFDKWCQMGFELGTILFVVKSLQKSKTTVNFKYLDVIFEKYYTIHAFSINEIEEYEKQKEQNTLLAKNICKNLGVYYENIDPVVDTYIVNWKNLGYDEETLLQISEYCFKSSIRTLEYMDKQVLKFYKLGITNTQSLNEYFDSVLEQEQELKEILEALNVSRNINNCDREYYRNWKNNWNMSKELIDYAISEAKDKAQPLMYMNKILSTYHTKNIHSVEDAKKCCVEGPQIKKTFNYEMRTYSKEEINSLFTNLDEIDI